MIYFWVDFDQSLIERHFLRHLKIGASLKPNHRTSQFSLSKSVKLSVTFILNSNLENPMIFNNINIQHGLQIVEGFVYLNLLKAVLI